MKTHIVLLLVSATFLAGCSDVLTHPTSRAITKAVQEGETTLDVGNICENSWDRLFIFGPYTAESDVHAGLGYQWIDFSKSDINISDGITLLVFIENGKVTTWFNHPRSGGDFADASKPGGYARSEAIFAIERSDATKRATVRFKEESALGAGGYRR
jgi:hypothetical protein